MAQSTYIARKGEDADFAALSADSLTLNGAAVDTAVLLASGQVVDLNGEADALIFDAAQAVRMDGSTAGHLKIKISGAYDFDITANTLTALSGSTIATNTLAETTAGSGVTVDSVLLKDGGAVFADGATIEVDTVNEATSTAGVTCDGVLHKDGGIVCADGATLEVDTVNEATSAAGVTCDGVLLKDTAVYGRTPVTAVTGDGAVSIPAYNKVFPITKAGVAAMTIADPTTGTHDGVTLTFIATTANAHTLDNSAGSGFFSSGGGTKDVATFGGAIGDGLTIIAYAGKWYIDPRGSTNITLG